MTLLCSRVISLYNRKTSIRLAKAEWEAVDAICQRENIKRKHLFEMIETNKNETSSLTSSIRLFLLLYYRYSLPLANNQSLTRLPVNPVFKAIRGIA